jgi:hypothetical protein
MRSHNHYHKVLLIHPGLDQASIVKDEHRFEGKQTILDIVIVESSSLVLYVFYIPNAQEANFRIVHKWQVR